ncbi:MAG: CotH kinase family protein [Oscillospiraceae bacterium]|jgi:hypothetical protein|nr:CotH kinase family protein [Oscillospiraceae bacterium]
MLKKKNTFLFAGMAVLLVALIAVALLVPAIKGSGKKADAFVSSDGNITFSHAGGLYEQPFSLLLSTKINKGVIRYTLDGSDPTSDSAQYAKGIAIADRTSEPNVLSAITGNGGFGMGQGENMPGREKPAIGGDGESVERPGRGERGGNRPDAALPEGEAVFPDGAPFGENPPAGAWADTPPEGNPFDENALADMPDFPAGNLPAAGGSAAAAIDNVFKGTVIKAAVFSESGTLLSGVASQSYFVSEDIFTRYKLPVVSIVTDAANFFDSTTGIFANYSQSGSDWERPVHFEMYEADGTAAVALNMGVRLNGGTTRSLAQKALRFYARKSYDEANASVDYELFAGLTTSYNDDLLTSFKRILLRSSGNDNSSTLFRDALMQSLVSDLQVDTQASRPCVAFVNGEFWGVYNIRERYDDHYFAAHYAIDTEKVAVLALESNSTPEINEGDESDLALYNEMYSFFESNTLTEEANYQKAQTYLDVDNLIDYYIANIYSANTDWPGNNNVFWRYKTDNGGYDGTAVWYQDGRFRWVMKDMDWGFGLRADQTNNTLLYALNESSSSRGMGFSSDASTLFFRKLIENEAFKAKFINRFCDVMNTNYAADTVTASISAMQAEIATAIPEQAARYPSSISGVGAWEANVAKLTQFAQERTGYMQGFLASRFALGDAVTVTLKTDGDGYISVNGAAITTATKGITDASLWSGSYFAGTTQTLAATPQEGHTFVKFIVTDAANGTTLAYTTNTIQLKLGSGATTVQAIFA